MNRLRIGISVVMALVGLVWIGQGIGLLGGSAMSGQSFWAAVGVVLILGAAGVAWTARRISRG